MHTNTLQSPTGRAVHNTRDVNHLQWRVSSTRQAAAVTCSLQTSSASGSTGSPTQHNTGSCPHFEQRSRCLNPSRSYGRRFIPHAAGRGGSRGRSSDDGSSSAWQDRVYNAGSPADGDSNSPRPQQQRYGRGGSSQRGSGRRSQQQQQQQQQQPQSYNPGRSSSGGSGGSGGGSGADGGSSEFVVIKKGSGGSAGTYIPTTQELMDQEDTLDGARYWDAALADYDEEDEYEDGDEEWEDDDDDELRGEDDDDDDVEVEEVVALLQELAAGLEDETTGDNEEGGEGESAAAAAAAGGASLAWRQAYLGSQQPPLTLGPVAVKQAAGKGRGLFTTEAVQAGDVLLTAAPLVLLYSEEGTTPENEELADHLATAVAATAAAASSSGGSKGLAVWQQHALLQLRGPGAAAAAESTSTPQQQQQQQQQEQSIPDLRVLLGPPEEPVEVHSGSNSSSSAAGQNEESTQQLEAPGSLPGTEQLTQLVFANCTGEEFEDQALVLLRGATSCGHLGVWPAAALINHSCAPNCHAMLLGDRLVVHAARDIPAATELTLSYLGPQLFAPAASRQEELKQQWGLDCGCSRCKAEARYTGSSSSSSSSSSGSGSSGSGSSSSSLADVLQSTYLQCQKLSPKLDAAVEAEDLSAVRAVQQELLALQAAVEGGVRAAKPPANVRRWLQASVYDLYDLLSLAADQLPPPPPKAAVRGGRGGRGRGRSGSSSSSSSKQGPAVETEALATCARIVGELTPGSSAHVELATEYMVRTEARFGGYHQEAADASRLCAAAITTRYAPISSSMLQLLMDTWAGAALI